MTPILWPCYSHPTSFTAQFSLPVLWPPTLPSWWSLHSNLVTDSTFPILQSPLTPPPPYLSPGPVCTLCDCDVTDSVYRQSTDCAWIVQMYCVTHSLSISVRQLFGIFSIHPSYYNTKDHKPDITAAQHKKHILHHKLSIFSPTCYFLYNQFINLF